MPLRDKPKWRVTDRGTLQKHCITHEQLNLWFIYYLLAKCQQCYSHSQSQSQSRRHVCYQAASSSHQMKKGGVDLRWKLCIFISSRIKFESVRLKCNLNIKYPWYCTCAMGCCARPGWGNPQTSLLMKQPTHPTLRAQHEACNTCLRHVDERHWLKVNYNNPRQPAPVLNIIQRNTVYN